MGTLITIRVLTSVGDVDDAMTRAFGWFHEVERRCTRFHEHSELRRLTSQAGQPVPVSAMLFEAVSFALMVAGESAGAFDPTVGHRMEKLGFDREHRTGEIARTPVVAHDVSYRDVEIDRRERTILLRRPLTLDLGAVAKGLAVDAAARELAPFRDFAIDAGGDLYLGGLNEQAAPWRIGIRHPRLNDALLTTLTVSNQAVCTSGDYERRRHIVDSRTKSPANRVASATVVAPGAMLADALATAAFVLGPTEGIRFLEEHGAEGLIVTPDLERFETRGLPHAA